MASSLDKQDTVPSLSDIPREVWLIAGTVVFGSFMSQLDASVVNVGLDTINRDLHSSLGTTQWIASGYILALATSIPASGWLVRKYGGKSVWLAALFAFTATSLLCAAAQSVEELIALRALQGLAGGMLLPTGQIISARAAGPARMGRVISTTGIAVVLAPVFGPVIGGLLIDASWRWLFLINVPVGVIGFVMGMRFLPRDPGEAAPGLDVPGLAWISIGLPSATYAITEAGRLSSVTKPQIVIAAVTGVVALIAFTRRELTTPAPIINVRILGNRIFGAATISSLFSAAALFGILILTPLYLEIQRGYSPLQTGLLMIPTGIGSAAFFPISGRLTDRYGGGAVAVFGLSLCLCGCLPMVFLSATVSIPVVLAVLAVTNLGFTMGLLPTVSAAYSAIRREHLPDATPIIMVSTRIGGSFGTAILVVILESRLHAGRAPVQAFHAAFWGAEIATALALLPALVLALAARRGDKGVPATALAEG